MRGLNNVHVNSNKITKVTFANFQFTSTEQGLFIHSFPLLSAIRMIHPWCPSNGLSDRANLGELLKHLKVRNLRADGSPQEQLAWGELEGEFYVGIAWGNQAIFPISDFLIFRKPWGL